MSGKNSSPRQSLGKPLPGFVDLVPFCGCAEKQPPLAMPWTHGDFTYATDGNLMIRVPRRVEVPLAPHPCAESAAQLFAANPLPPAKAFIRLPLLSATDTKTPIGTRLLATAYLRKLSELPAVHVGARKGKWNDPLRFVFDGGEGLLMPLSQAT